MSKLINTISWLAQRLFGIAAWSNVFLIGLVILGIVASALRTNVALAWGFNLPLVGSRLTVGGVLDLQSVLFAVVFLFAGGKTVLEDRNVRVDVLYKLASPHVRKIIDVIGIVFLALPFVCLLIIPAIEFVQRSYGHGEVSINGGIESVYIFKSILPLALAVMALALVVRLVRVLNLPNAQGEADGV